jgi:hypothetical protein
VKTQFSTFNAADYLDDEETIAEYLTAAVEDENPDVLLSASPKSPKRAACRKWPQTPGWVVRAFTKRSLQVRIQGIRP